MKSINIKYDEVKKIVPEKTYTKLTYTTSDGEIFDAREKAESHELVLAYTQDYNNVKQVGSFYYLRDWDDLEAVGVILTKGYLDTDWHDEVNFHKENFPFWADVSHDGYYITIERAMNTLDLQEMLNYEKQYNLTQKKLF